MKMRFLILATAILVSGCGLHQPSALHPNGAGLPPGVAGVSNPLFVPVADREFAWNQLVDELDNYFKIEREERVQQVGHVLTEGSIKTFPTPGSTILEPWRKDSASGYERMHATLQSIRRHAHMRVVPTQDGFSIELAVFKELEDLIQPEGTTTGSMTLRHDTSPERTDERGSRLAPGSLGWIPQGRDVALEQRILSNIRGRLTHYIPPQPGEPLPADFNAHAPPP